MYAVGVKRDFTARHYLVGPDLVAENYPHQHHYVLEARFEGYELDRNGFLVDIAAVERLLDEVIVRYQHKTLNELPELEGINPSLENLSRIVCMAVVERVHVVGLTMITIKISESDQAWASCSHECASP